MLHPQDPEPSTMFTPHEKEMQTRDLVSSPGAGPAGGKEVRRDCTISHC